MNLPVAHINRLPGRSGILTGPAAPVILALLALLFLQPLSISGQENVFRQKISLPGQNSSIYSVLSQISGKTGYFFVYDTELVSSDRRVRLRAGDMALSSWLDEIIDDPSLEFKIIENHILIYKPRTDIPDAGVAMEEKTEQQFIALRGRILDEGSRNPLPFATVGIEGKALGITANSDGVFMLKIPGEYIDDQLTISHLGYKTQQVPVLLFVDNRLDILLETDYISIQEVMIRYFDPVAIVKSAIEKKSRNYSSDQVYLLSFYREGVQRNNKFINYSEAFFRIYKSSYYSRPEQNQVRLLQSRTISNVDQTDTLILKIRAGIRSSLELDFISSIPEFINPEFMQDYDFTKAGIVLQDGKRVFAVAFEQKQHITEPLYKGVLYIDMESMAFLGAEFELHPKYINKAQSQFITRRSRDYRASVERAAYTISYKYHDGKYYLNHVRADVDLRYRRRLQLFGLNYNAFVELVTSRIETDGVTRFARKEVLRTDRVFMDRNYEYDHDFWSDYSIIEPEKHITQALSRINLQVENFVAGEEEGILAGQDDQ